MSRSVHVLKKQIRAFGWSDIKTVRVPEAKSPGCIPEMHGRKLRLHPIKVELQFYNPTTKRYFVVMHETVLLALRQAVVNLDTGDAVYRRFACQP